MKITITLDSGKTFRTISTKRYKIHSQLPGHANREQKRLMLDVGKALAAAAQQEKPDARNN